MNSIKINGNVYPCRMTMGAIVRFKQITGKELSQIDGNSLTDVLTFVWCCIKSSSSYEGYDFSMSVEELGDAVTVEDFISIQAALFATADNGNGTDKKKRTS